MFHIRDNCFNPFDEVSCSGNFPIGIMDGLFFFFFIFFFFLCEKRVPGREGTLIIRINGDHVEKFVPCKISHSIELKLKVTKFKGRASYVSIVV